MADVIRREEDVPPDVVLIDWLVIKKTDVSADAAVAKDRIKCGSAHRANTSKVNAPEVDVSIPVVTDGAASPIKN
jgi:hypothetical protein